MAALKTTARIILNELQSRGVRTQVINADIGLMRYEWRDRWHALQSSFPETSSLSGRFVSERKPLTNSIARSLGVPVPESCTVEGADEPAALHLLERYRTVVVKPTDGSHGQGVTVGVTTAAQLLAAIQCAKQSTHKGRVLVQEQVRGDDVRALVIGRKFVAALHRVPAQVTGDGRHTLRELIEADNASNPERGRNYEKNYNFIDLPTAERYLGARIDHETPADAEVVRVAGAATSVPAAKRTT